MVGGGVVHEEVAPRELGAVNNKGGDRTGEGAVFVLVIVIAIIMMRKRARKHEVVNESIAFRSVVLECAKEILGERDVRFDATGVSALAFAAEKFAHDVTTGTWALTHEFGREGATRVRVTEAEADKAVVLADAVKRYLFREVEWEQKLRKFAGSVVNKHAVNMRQAFRFEYDVDKEDPAELLERWNAYQDTVMRVMPEAAREVLQRRCGQMPGLGTAGSGSASASAAAAAAGPPGSGES